LVATADRAEVDKLFVRISAVSEVAELDDNFAVVEHDEQGSLLTVQLAGIRRLLRSNRIHC